MPLLFDFINRQFLTSPPQVHTSFADRTVIVTGASSGLGLETVRLLTTLQASHIILAVRNPSKAEAAISSIRSTNPNTTTKLEIWPLDLSSFDSVLTFATRALDQLPRLDSVILNAGIWPHIYHATPTDNHEEGLQTNVLSSALLACALHPLLAPTARDHKTLTHVTFVGSELYEYAAFAERRYATAAPSSNATNPTKTTKTTKPTMTLIAALDDPTLASKHIRDRYNTTKLLITLVAQEMARLAPLTPTADADGEAVRVGVVIDVVAPG